MFYKGKIYIHDAKIITPKFKWTHTSLSLNAHNGEKRGVFSLIIGLTCLTYKGIIGYLNWKKAKQLRKGIKGHVLPSSSIQ